MKDNEIYLLSASKDNGSLWGNRGNTCVYYSGDSMVFIDCGKSDHLMYVDYVKDIKSLVNGHTIKNVFFVSTHPHVDHYKLIGKLIVKVINPEKVLAIVFRIDKNKTYSSQEENDNRIEYDKQFNKEIEYLNDIKIEGKTINIVTPDICSSVVNLNTIPGIKNNDGMITDILDNISVYGNDTLKKPDSKYGNPKERNENNYQNDVGVVVKIKRDNGSVLFTGDMSYHFWYDAYKNDKEIKHIVLPHHGGFAWVADVDVDTNKRGHFYKDNCKLYLSANKQNISGDLNDKSSAAYFVKEAFNVNPKKIKSTKDGMITI